MSIKVDPTKLEELSVHLKQLERTVEGGEHQIYSIISQLIREIRSEYSEWEVQQALNEVEDDLREIRKQAAIVTEGLARKSSALSQAAGQYQDKERTAQAMIEQYQLPSSYYTPGGGLADEGADNYLKDQWFEDPVVQELHLKAMNGTEEEQKEAKEKLDAIFQARNTIARAQVAYAVYKAFGNQALMTHAHKEATKQRKILKEYGIHEDLYGERVKLDHLYPGSPLSACSYDPSLQIIKDNKPILILMPLDNQYIYLLSLINKGEPQGVWARKQLDEIHKLLSEIGRAQVAWYEYKAKDMKKEMDGAHIYAEKLRTILKEKYSLSSEMVDDTDYKFMWTGAGAAGKYLNIFESNSKDSNNKHIVNLLTPVYFSQVDSRWANKMYSKKNDKSQTIGTSGCGPTSMAMILSTLLGREITPVELCDFALKNGYRTLDSGTSWMFYKAVAKEYGLECKQTSSLSEVKKALKDGGSMAVSSMGKGHFTKGGHFIVINGMELRENDLWFNILDPNSKNTSYGRDGKIIIDAKNDGKVKALESVIATESKQYWVFRNPSVKIDIDRTSTPAVLTEMNKNLSGVKITTLSKQAVKFLHGSEGYSAYIYKDQAGKNTIGYGHLIRPGEIFKEPMSEQDAMDLYNKDIKRFIDSVVDFDKKYSLNLTQNQFDALVSFTYNLGENFWKEDSKLKKLLISGKYTNEELMKTFGLYHKVTENGVSKPSRGLYNRRIDEAEVFLYGDYKRDTTRPLPH